MTPLGTTAPHFALPDVTTGETVSTPATGRPLLVMFICRHCPYVKHVESELGRLGRDHAATVDLIAISANDAQAYPDDAPESLAEFAKLNGFTFPVLYDESQAVARAYGAACTPDFFLFDNEHALVYRGRLDSSRPNSGIAVNGSELRAALDAVLAGDKPAAEQHPSIGCGIKWK